MGLERLIWRTPTFSTHVLFIIRKHTAETTAAAKEGARAPTPSRSTKKLARAPLPIATIPMPKDIIQNVSLSHSCLNPICNHFCQPKHPVTLSDNHTVKWEDVRNNEKIQVFLVKLLGEIRHEENLEDCTTFTAHDGIDCKSVSS